jgi:hypothetical protein
MWMHRSSARMYACNTCLTAPCKLWCNLQQTLPGVPAACRCTPKTDAAAYQTASTRKMEPSLTMVVPGTEGSRASLTRCTRLTRCSIKRHTLELDISATTSNLMPSYQWLPASSSVRYRSCSCLHLLRNMMHSKHAALGSAPPRRLQGLFCGRSQAAGSRTCAGACTSSAGWRRTPARSTPGCARVPCIAAHARTASHQVHVHAAVQTALVTLIMPRTSCEPLTQQPAHHPAPPRTRHPAGCQAAWQNAHETSPDMAGCSLFARCILATHMWPDGTPTCSGNGMPLQLVYQCHTSEQIQLT